MNAISSLILFCCENGYSEAIYNSTFRLSAVSLPVSLFLNRKPYGFSAKTFLKFLLLFLPTYLLCGLLVGSAVYGFESVQISNINRICFWLPLTVIPAAKIMKLPYLKLCDYCAPCFAVAVVTGTYGCPFVGCCHGFPCSWGIYNPILHERVFPSQIIEWCSIVLIVIVLFIYARRTGHDGSGRVMALFLILFGFTRFILLFFRADTKLFWGISELGLSAFFTLVEGVIMMILLRRRSHGAPAPELNPS